MDLDEEDLGSLFGPKYHLDEVADRIGQDPPDQVTVRELLRWFGAERRGAHIVKNIRKELRAHGLRTVPDFEETWIDGEIRFERTAEEGTDAGARGNGTSLSKGEAKVIGIPGAAMPASSPESAKSMTDPVQRIGRLPAANRPPCSVPLGVALDVAITEMMLHDYSQIPVMQGARDCRGAVTWQSIAKNFARGRKATTVNDCIESVVFVKEEDSVLGLIPTIVQAGFVLVQARDRTIKGIVTTADVSEQFRVLSEPFILLGQIEHHLRIVARRSASPEELRAAKHQDDTSRSVDDPDDLTFGELVRVLEPTSMWKRLGLPFDRTLFLAALKEVHKIRNDVMHFDPDGVSEKEITVLRNFARLLEQVVDP